MACACEGIRDARRRNQATVPAHAERERENPEHSGHGTRHGAEDDAERVGALTTFALTQTRSDVDAALSQLEAARIKLVALRDVYLPKATQIRLRVELAYRRGAASLLDFLDAERTYRAATLSWIASQGSYDVAVSQLEAAIGGSLP